MPAWPKSFLNFGASVQTATTARTLARKNAAVPAQQRVFQNLTQSLANTKFWRPAGVEAGMSYADFRARIVPRSYDQMAPAIAQMKRGEADVLWPGRCSFFVRTAGTTTGSPSVIPVTDAMLEHVQRGAQDALFYYTARTGHAGIFRGRHLWLDGSTALGAIEEAKPFEAYETEVGGIAALNLTSSAEAHLYEPGARVAELTDWPAKIRAIIQRTRSLDITLLGGLPNWLLLLAQALRADSLTGKQRVSNLTGLWPNLECCLHTGIPVAPFHEELRAVLGPNVEFHEVYSAAEGYIATQDADRRAGLRLMSDAGLFFEFLPLVDLDESRLEQLGPKAVPLEGVRVGVDYALLLTTPAGLVRYLVGDVVRFTSLEPPRLIYAGRTKLRLNSSGERVMEKELTDALVTVCHRHNWSITHFHVAPLFLANFTGQNHGRHEWWIELVPGTVTTPTGPLMAIELDHELQRLNPEYAARRKAGPLEAPIVRLVMPGVFAHWQRFKGRWSGQYKVPRCSEHRTVADELAKVTNFATD